MHNFFCYLSGYFLRNLYLVICISLIAVTLLLVVPSNLYTCGYPSGLTRKVVNRNSVMWTIHDTLRRQRDFRPQNASWHWSSTVPLYTVIRCPEKYINVWLTVFALNRTSYSRNDPDDCYFAFYIKSFCLLSRSFATILTTPAAATTLCGRGFRSRFSPF